MKAFRAGRTMIHSSDRAIAATFSPLLRHATLTFAAHRPCLQNWVSTASEKQRRRQLVTVVALRLRSGLGWRALSVWKAMARARQASVRTMQARAHSGSPV